VELQKSTKKKKKNIPSHQKPSESIEAHLPMGASRPDFSAFYRAVLFNLNRTFKRLYKIGAIAFFPEERKGPKAW